MEATPFTKLLHAYYLDASCGFLLVQDEFNNTRFIYQVPIVATQLKYLELDVFSALSQLGLEFFFRIAPCSVLPELVNWFLTGYKPDSGHVRMQAFADVAPIEFKFNAADVCVHSTYRLTTLPLE